MNWEERFCPNGGCAVDFWLVQQWADNDELWRVSDRFGGGDYTIAAADPICPRCGETLCLSVELAQRSGEVLQAGKLLEFVRSLR